MGPAMDLILGPLYSRQGRMARGAFLRAFGLWLLVCVVASAISPFLGGPLALIGAYSVGCMAVRREQDLMQEYETLPDTAFHRSFSPSQIARMAFLALGGLPAVLAARGWTIDDETISSTVFVLLVSLTAAAFSRTLFLSPGYVGPNPYGAAPGSVSR